MWNTKQPVENRLDDVKGFLCHAVELSEEPKEPA